MKTQTDEAVTLQRDCKATLIPFGNVVTLKAGEAGHITQSLGGSYTLMIGGNLFRIESQDGDAIGKKEPAKGPTEVPEAEAPETEGPVKEAHVWEAMKTCYDPEIPVNIVDLGLIYSCRISPQGNSGSLVEVKMTLTAPGCGMGPIIAREVEERITSVPGVDRVRVELVWDPPWDRSMISEAARLQLGLL